MTVANTDVNADRAMTREEARALMNQAEEEFDQAEKDFRLQQKLAMCGSWNVYFLPSTGLPRWRQLFCNDYRRCPVCLERKVEEWAEAFGNYAGNLYFEVVREEDWARTRREWSKKEWDWFQVPIEGGGSRLVLFDQRHSNNDRKVRKDFFSGPTGTGATSKNAQLLTLGDILVQMPKNKRVGGKLVYLSTTKQDKEESDRVEIEIVVPDVKDKAAETKTHAAMKVTLDQTAQCDPHNAAEVEECCAIRMAVFKSELERRNIKILSSHLENRYVKSDAIRWGKTYLATDLQESRSGVRKLFIAAQEQATQQEMTLQ